METNAERPGKKQRARVFLSYSRTDRAIAERLRDRLIGEGFDAYLDIHDIVKGEPWRERLQNLIFGADVVLFLLSPDSIASEICDWEVNEAERLGKRVVPVMCRPSPDELVPGRLKRLNYAFLDSDEKWANEFPALCEALDRDIAWLREHTRLSELAARWERDGRPEAQLLRLAVARDARKWEARRPADAVLSEVLIAFLEASENKEAQDRDRLLTITGRAFVKPAEQALAEGRFDAALRFAAAGMLLGEDLDMRLVPERMQSVAPAAGATALRAVLFGHESDVRSACFSPNGTCILTASSDGTARVWDAASAQEIAVLQGHEGPLLNALFSPDGARVVTMSENGGSHVWELATRRQLLLWRGEPMWGASFSADGARVAAISSEHVVHVYEAASGREIATLRGHAKGVSSASFSPDGARVVTASFDRTARLWNASTGRQLAVLQGHELPVEHASFSVDGALVVTASEDSTARVWDSAGREIAVLQGHQQRVRAAWFSPDGARIVTVAQDRTPRLWDAVSGREAAVLRGHEGDVCSASFSADGTRIVTASHDGAARIWESLTGRELAIMRGHERELRSASFDPGGTRIVTASADKTARIWDAAVGCEVAVLRGHEAEKVLSAAFSPDGMSIVTGAQDSTARLWDAATGREKLVLRGHEDDVQQCAFSPDGNHVVTFSTDRTARVWDAATGDQVEVVSKQALPRPENSHSADGTRIIIGTREGAGWVYDTRGNRIAELRGHEWGINSAAFSPDGTRGVTAADDGTARIWDVARTIALVGDPAEFLAASLTKGRGLKTENEQADLLMQAAPDNLYEALTDRLTPTQRENVARRAEILARLLHPSCYLPPSARPGFATPPEAATGKLLPTNAPTPGAAAAVKACAASASEFAGAATPRQGRASLALLALIFLALAVGGTWLLTHTSLLYPILGLARPGE
jgi:WD40 repeat protein